MNAYYDESYTYTFDQLCNFHGMEKRLSQKVPIEIWRHFEERESWVLLVDLFRPFCYVIQRIGTIPFRETFQDIMMGCKLGKLHQ